MLFSVYLEHFLFKDPLIKDLCNRNKLLAFAEDMVVVAESWSDVRTIMRHLTKTLEDGGLLLSLPKSIIMTTRDYSLPADSDDELTEDEESDPRVRAVRNREKPILIDERVRLPKGARSEIPRKRFTEFGGMKIQQTFKYLGLDLATNKEEICSGVRK